MDSSKSGKAEGTRGEVKEAHKLLQTLLKPGLPTRKKARFYEYSRSSKTGERILKEHVIPKRRYKKKTKPRNRTAETYSSKQRDNVTPESSIATNEIVNNMENIYGTEISNEIPNRREDVFTRSTELLRTMIRPVGRKKYKTKSWFDRTKSNQDKWRRNRPLIWEIMLAVEELTGFCSVCNDRDAVIRCDDCCNSALCYVCDDIVHTNLPLHDRCVFLDGIQQRITPLEAINDNMDIEPTVKSVKLKCFSCEHCDGKNIRQEVTDDICMVVTLKGRYDIFKYRILCEDCGGITNPFDISSVLKSGYWPGSPCSINHLIKEDVFILWDAFRSRMPGSSLKAFLTSLCDIGEYYGRTNMINVNTFSSSFKEWKYWRHEKDMIQKMNWLECPPCTVKQHSCHVDGNCKLYRYSSSGKRRRPSYYGEMLFGSNEKVNSYLEQLYGNWSFVNKGDTQCGGRWSAARNVKRKAKSLDETGLEVATCRHVIGQKAVNMFQGELFGYSLFIMKEFMIPNSVTFCFADVMCKLWKFICKHAPDISIAIKPALSIMHAKGHAHDCQVLWSGQWLNGTGKSTGEETEQIFSYLSRFGSTTKHQTPENREETITEMVQAWNKRKIKNIVVNLKKRYIKNEREIMKSIQVLRKLESETNLQIRENVSDWIKEIKNTARGIHLSKSKKSLTNSEKAVLLINDLEVSSHIELLAGMFFPKHIKKSAYYSLLDFDKSDKTKEFERLCKVVSVTKNVVKNSYEQIKEYVWKPLLQKEIEKLFMEKVIWATNIKKAADTSKRRHILRGKQAVVNNKFKEILNEYQKLYCCNTDDNELYDLCEKGSFPWLNTNVNVVSGTAVDRRICVEAYLNNTHLCEEKEILLEEMQSCLHYFCSKVKLLEADYKRIMTEVESSGEEELEYGVCFSMDPAIRGRLVLVKTAIAYYQGEIEKALATFRGYFDSDGLHVCEGASINRDIISRNESSTENSNESDTHLSDEESSATSPIEMFDIADISFDFISSMGMELGNSFAFGDCTVKEKNESIDIMLPTDCCQNKLAGSNGSNACVIISLLVGYMMTNSKGVLAKNNNYQQFCESFISIFCGAVYAGNFLYDHHDTRGFLHIVEALSILPATININIGDENNIFASEFKRYIEDTSQLQCNYFSVLIVNNMAVCILPTERGVVIVDSHGYDPYGGKVSFIDNKNIPDEFPLFNKDNDLAYTCVVKCR